MVDSLIPQVSSAGQTHPPETEHDLGVHELRGFVCLLEHLGSVTEQRLLPTHQTNVLIHQFVSSFFPGQVQVIIAELQEHVGKSV